MNIDTFEKSIQFLNESQNDVFITFHGGEQTLQGVEWYKKQIQILSKYSNVKQCSIQSNGKYLSEDLLNFFYNNNIQMSFSFDGKYHNITRGYSTQILNNIEKYNKKFETKSGQILMINSNNYNNLLEEYKYLNSLNLFHSISMNHIHDTLSNKFGINNINEYIQSYKKLFEYYLLTNNYITIRNFDDILNLMNGNNNQICSMKGECVQNWLGIFPNGDIQNCDYYYNNEEMIYGNVSEFKNIVDMYNKSKNYINYKNKIVNRKQYCINHHCSIYNLCNGGCNQQIYSVSGQIETPNKKYCNLRKMEINQIMEIINNINIEKILNNKLQKLVQNIHRRKYYE